MYYVKRHGGFQFLIGSLKTTRASLLTLEVNRFQFLIGSLKTLSAKRAGRYFLWVSIPYR